VTDELFDRTARFYHAVLRAGPLEQWARLMSATEVRITADESWIQQPGAQRLLVFLVNMLARCFGTITIAIAPSVPLVIDPVLVPPRDTLVDALRDMVMDVRGPAFAPEPPLHPLRIHVGPKPPKVETIAVAADGWRGVLWGRNAAPATFAGVPNAAGAFLAALLGATAIVRGFIEAVTTDDPEVAEDEEDVILVDGARRERFGSPLGTVQMDAGDFFQMRIAPPWDGRNLGTIVLSSIGALNGAVLFLMALCGDLRACVVGFEPQPLERSNLNRYLYALACWVPTLKTRVAEALATAVLQIRAHARPVDGELDPFPEGATVSSGADNDDARHAAQRLARGPLLSLATDNDQVHVSRHAPRDGPCVGCIYPGDTVGGEEIPTHPLVAGWAGLLGLLTLLGVSGYPPGSELRFSALRPHERSLVTWLIRPNCLVCGGRGVS
jgi:hypothetical protein